MCARVSPRATEDVERGLGISGHIHSGAKLRPKEPRGFQRLHRFSRNPNIHNKLGNLLSLKQQLQQLGRVEFGPISVIEKAGPDGGWCVRVGFRYCILSSIDYKLNSSERSHESHA